MPRARHLAVAALVAGSIISLGFATQPQQCSTQSLPLHEIMGRMADAKDALGEALIAQDSQAALLELKTLQENIIISKSLTPDTFSSLTPEERPLRAAEYRTHFVSILQTLCAVELLIIAEDHKTAATMLDYTLFDQQRAAHDAFIPQNDD